MNLETRLAEEKTTLLRRWFDLVAGAYPPETSRLLQKEKDPFANPVGHSLREGMEGIYEEILQGSAPEKSHPFLDRIIRIRAIQEFSPSQAVAFLFLLKHVVREATGEDVRENRISLQDVLAFESKVDELTLLAFNIYMECREKLYEVRVNEVKNRTRRLLQRANLLEEVPWREPQPKDRDDI